MGAGLLLRPVQGQACTKAAMSYVYDSGAPRDADVSLNAPLIVTLNADSTAPLLDSYPELVHVATGLAVPLADPRYVMPTQFGPRRVVSFVPLAELEPTATYRVGVKMARDASAVGTTEETASWEFTTGTSRVPAMSVDGTFGMLFEEAVVTHRDCPAYEGCGEYCVDNGTDRVTKAHVTLPRILGGFRDYGLAAHVILTNDAPYSYGAPPEVTVATQVDVADATEPVTVELIVPPRKSGEAFRPCVLAQITDARGDSLDVAAQCFDAITPIQVALERDHDEPSADGVDQPGAAGSKRSSACSFGSSPSSVGDIWLSATVLAACGLLRRRRAQG
jgi:hypothetical protein